MTELSVGVFVLDILIYYFFSLTLSLIHLSCYD